MPDFIATDLHGHSLYSDGRATPEAYIHERAECGLDVVALSDHDTFAGIPRAKLAADERDIVLVPAMEVSSFVHFGTDCAEQFHVLAYFPPAMLEDGSLWRTRLAQRAGLFHRRWREHVLAWIDSLPEWEAGPLDPDTRLHALVGAEFPQLQAMIDLVHERNRSLLRDFHSHQVRFLDDEELFGWQPEELVDVIRADGALDIVAHPTRARDKGRMTQLIDYASGIEVYTSRHRANVAARFRALADERGCHWTASVDDHQRGPYSPPPCGTPATTVHRILAGPRIRDPEVATPAPRASR